MQMDRGNRTPTNGAKVVTNVLVENIFSRHGTPKAIISDDGTHICNKLFENIMEKYGAKYKVAT